MPRHGVNLVAFSRKELGSLLVIGRSDYSIAAGVEGVNTLPIVARVTARHPIDVFVLTE